jgi:hypothetical protein
LGINPLFSTTGRSLFKRSFSKTLYTMGKRLQEENDLCHFPISLETVDRDTIEYLGKIFYSYNRQFFLRIFPVMRP